MRVGNQIKVKKTGGSQKVPDGQVQYQVSPEQKLFNTETYNRSIAEEKRVLKRITSLVEKSPVYTRYLVNIPGVGPSTAAVLLSQFVPEKVYYVSNMFSFAGIVAGKDKLRKGEKASFNTFLRAKLIGVMGVNFIKQKSDYAIYYYNKRMQLINRDRVLIDAGEMNPSFVHNDKYGMDRPTAAHHSRMATRYMVQRFVRDYYVAFRTIMDIPVVPPYEEAYLALKHVGTTYTSADTFLDRNPKDDGSRQSTQSDVKNLSEVLKSMLIQNGYAKFKEEDLEEELAEDTVVQEVEQD